MTSHGWFLRHFVKLRKITTKFFQVLHEISEFPFNEKQALWSFGCIQLKSSFIQISWFSFCSIFWKFILFILRNKQEAVPLAYRGSFKIKTITRPNYKMAKTILGPKWSFPKIVSKLNRFTLPQNGYKPSQEKLYCKEEAYWFSG